MEFPAKQRVLRVTERNLQHDLLVCIDLKRNLWVKRGFPRNGDTGIVDNGVMRNLSGPPYIFKASTATFYDLKHPRGITLRDLNIIFMHGGRKPNGPWMFSSFDDGYPVVETTRAVNEYLRSRGEPAIQVVLSCNEYAAPLGVRVADFLSHEHVVQAVGETVGLVSGAMYEDGSIHCSVQANEFWGLNVLAIVKALSRSKK